MSQFQISNQQNIDYTLIANPFIDDFLADANDVQIKVYLYLLRHQTDSEKCSISAMADFFNYSEKDVLRALSYWERKKVLWLSYNNKNEQGAPKTLGRSCAKNDHYQAKVPKRGGKRRTS